MQFPLDVDNQNNLLYSQMLVYLLMAVVKIRKVSGCRQLHSFLLARKKNKHKWVDIVIQVDFYPPHPFYWLNKTPIGVSRLSCWKSPVVISMTLPAGYIKLHCSVPKHLAVHPYRLSLLGFHSLGQKIYADGAKPALFTMGSGPQDTLILAMTLVAV